MSSVSLRFHHIYFPEKKPDHKKINYPARSKEIEILSLLIAFYFLDSKRQGSLVYSHVSLFISCLFTSISFYLYVNPNSRLSLSIPIFLPVSILRISTYIFFYLFSIHLYFIIPLWQSRLMPISFYLFANPNSRLYLSMFFSLFQYIPHIFTSITFYLLWGKIRQVYSPKNFLLPISLKVREIILLVDLF